MLFHNYTSVPHALLFPNANDRKSSTSSQASSSSTHPSSQARKSKEFKTATEDYWNGPNAFGFDPVAPQSKSKSKSKSKSHSKSKAFKSATEEYWNGPNPFGYEPTAPKTKSKKSKSPAGEYQNSTNVFNGLGHMLPARA
ncbi:MAG: hypothetical protein M1818_007274 [Claussenomyces sp. TS43310]|nr:MAG: hypothetical protein M1818_007274 [Claussenomyces sp. TS43310]